MSEANILNPTATSPYSPDYPIGRVKADRFSRAEMKSGEVYSRETLVRGRVLELQWSNRLMTEALYLERWQAQYERGFFSLYDIERARYYSGRFAGPLQVSDAGNEKVNVRGQFVELPGKALYADPTNWDRDAIFLEERDDDGNDQVKLTGTWDRRTKNYSLWSESLDNAAWVKAGSGGAAAPTVAADATTDPNGTNTADRVDFAVTGVGQSSDIYQDVTVPAVKGKTFIASAVIWAAGAGSIELHLSDNAFTESSSLVVNYTAGFNWFTVSHTFGAAANNGLRVLFRNPASQAAKSVYIWGVQVEYGAARSQYTFTQGATAELVAPLALPDLHGGFAQFNAGTIVNDGAEIEYTGYGFRIWSPKGPDFGILNYSVDGVAATAVDLYSAAGVTAAAVATYLARFGKHRVRLYPSNTKNAAAAAYNIAYDAIEVMQ